MTVTEPLAWLVRTREAEVLMSPLLYWLKATQRLRSEGGLFVEFPWAGRRVDLVTFGKRRRTSAFELKLGSTGRALEQAIYNRAAFDRSYMVLAHLPGEDTLIEARRYGVGVIVASDSSVRLWVESPLVPPTPVVRKRLLADLRNRPSLSAPL